MNNPNVAKKVSKEVFLAPLMIVIEMHEHTRLQVELMRKRVSELMAVAVKSNEALPTHLRPRHLFMLETQMDQVNYQIAQARVAVENAIGHLRDIAKDALTIDPYYREDALGVLYRAEQIAQGNVKLIDSIVEEVELTNSILLTID